MVPSLEAKLWLFTKSGMVYPVAVQKLPAESKISDEANIEQVKQPWACLPMQLLTHCLFLAGCSSDFVQQLE